MATSPDRAEQSPSKLPGVGTTVFTLMSRLAEEHGAVNLGQGFPDFDPPRVLVEALTEALGEGHHQYAPMAGLPELRAAIAANVEHRYGRRVDAGAEVTVTAGASEAIFDAILATVDRGDEVILLDPCYDSYEPAVVLAGGKTVHVPLSPIDFSVAWQRVADAMTARTRLLVINSPHNPSGATLSAADLDALAELLRGTSVRVLADEVYEHIVFDGAVHQSVLRHPELAARSYVASSFGKTYHCTGWRVGYCIAPPRMTAELRKVHQFNTFSVCRPAQRAFAATLERLAEHHQELAGFYQAKRGRFRELLAATSLQPLPVSGGYFQVVDYTPLSTEPDTELAGRLVREHGVAVIPMSPFYSRPPAEPRRLRLCFAKHDRTLEAGVQRLAAAFPHAAH